MIELYSLPTSARVTSTTPLASRYDIIENNTFRNTGPRIKNGKETISLGAGSSYFNPLYTVVQNTLFENCDGDAEIISIEGNLVTIRYNTFKWSAGAVVRSGNASSIYGNKFLGGGEFGTRGVRLSGVDHVIHSNYFESWVAETLSPPFSC